MDRSHAAPPPRPGATLTVDLGNTRCKLRGWSEPPAQAAWPALAAAASCPLDGALGRAVEAFARALERSSGGPLAIALSSVASAEATATVRRALAAACGQAEPEPAIEIEIEIGAGLAIAAEPPEAVGRDRLFAARAACELCGDAIVVDLGTALTVDAVRWRDGAAWFEGGAIAAGPAVLARALSSSGARLCAFEPVPGAPALGRSTVAALQAGVAHGVRGALRELVGALGRELGLERAPVLVTGGARSFLTTPALPEELRGRARIEPELVHLGLWSARRGPPRPPARGALAPC